MGFARRSLLLAGLGGAGALAGAGCGPVQAQSRASAPLALTIGREATQSGMLIGQTEPGASVDVDGLAAQPDGEGRFLIGFDRDAPARARVTARAGDGRVATADIDVAPRVWQVRSVSGLPPATVNPPPSAMARIERDSAIKQRAFSSVDDRATGWRERFSWPLASVRVTSPWGAQRRLNGDLQRPHYGIDLGAATGTPVRAPASGVVVLAEPDMHFEGGMVAIDHGQGLITMYLHMSRLDATVGQRLERGVQIGAVGARGRDTGPHLCWRMRWRGRQLDPSLRTTA